MEHTYVHMYWNHCKSDRYDSGVVDESCWFLVCPSTKQRSDGEKVSVTLYSVYVVLGQTILPWRKSVFYFHSSKSQ